MSENTQGVLYKNAKWLQHNGKLLTVNYRGSVSFDGTSYETLKVPIRIYSGQGQDSTVYRQEWMVENLNLPLGNDSNGNSRDNEWDSLSDDDKTCEVIHTNGGVLTRKALSEGHGRPDGWWIDRFEPPYVFDDEHDAWRKDSARSILINGRRYYNDAAIEVIDEMIKDTGWRVPRPQEYLYLMNYFGNLTRLYSSAKPAGAHHPIDEYYPDPVGSPNEVEYYCSQFRLNPTMVTHEKVPSSTSTGITVQNRVIFDADPENTARLIFSMFNGEGDNSVVHYRPSDSVVPSTQSGPYPTWGWGIYSYGSGTVRCNKTLKEILYGNGFGAIPTRGIATMSVNTSTGHRNRKVRLILDPPMYSTGGPSDPTEIPPVMKIGFAYRDTDLAPYFYPIRLVRLNNFNL